MCLKVKSGFVKQKLQDCERYRNDLGKDAPDNICNGVSESAKRITLTAALDKFLVDHKKRAQKCEVTDPVCVQKRVKALDMTWNKVCGNYPTKGNKVLNHPFCNEVLNELNAWNGVKFDMNQLAYEKEEAKPKYSPNKECKEAVWLSESDKMKDEDLKSVLDARETLFGKGCGNSSQSQVCSGYVVCKGSAGVDYLRKVTCSVRNCGEGKAQKCNEELGYGSRAEKGERKANIGLIEASKVIKGSVEEYTMKKQRLSIICLLTLILISVESYADGTNEIIISGKFTAKYVDKKVVSVRTSLGQEFCLPKTLFKKKKTSIGKKFTLKQDIEAFNKIIAKYNYKSKKKKQGRPCQIKN